MVSGFVGLVDGFRVTRWTATLSLEDQPPVGIPAGLRVHNAKRHYAATESIGRYLIDRGYPLIGVGTSTLAFLIEQDKVAKVARYCREKNRIVFEQHRHQRNLDVLHSLHHPDAFADTRYHWVQLNDAVHAPYWYFFHEVYIQMLVVPIARPAFHRYVNWQAITAMTSANPQTKFDQWGETDDGRLLCYDYA